MDLLTREEYAAIAATIDWPRAAYIDGKYRKGKGAKLKTINPATGEVIGHCPHASAAELDMALDAAAKGFEVWRKKTPLKRQKVMEGPARNLEARIDEVAATLTMEQGKPFPESKLEIGFVCDMFRWYGEEGKRDGQPSINYVKGANIAGFIKVADAMLAYGVA